MPFKNQPPLYSIWLGMRARCRNPNLKAWQHYGGRGITVCERWSDFRMFEEDMGPRPTSKHSLDRIDPNGDYSPENCRWADRTEQARNTRTTRWVEIEGKRYRVADLAEISGHKGDVIIERAARRLPYDLVISPEKFISRRKPVEAVQVRVANQMARTHCKNGHEFTPENTYRPTPNSKSCRICHNEKMRRINAQKRAAKSLPA